MTFKDEIITFQTPPYEQSIFLYDVEENDIPLLISLFSSFGLLYKSKRLQSTQSIVHMWFYSYNAFQKFLIAFPQNIIPFADLHHQVAYNRNLIAQKYHPTQDVQDFKEMKEEKQIDQYYRFSIAKTVPSHFTRKQLRLDQMYELCNYYFGCQFWSSEIVNLSCDFKDEFREKNVRKYSFQYTTVTKIRFLNYPDCVLRGYGRSKYTGKDVIRADRTAKKFSIACARKDMFSRLLICVLVDSRSGQMEGFTQKGKDIEELTQITKRVEELEKQIRFTAIPTCIDIGKQDENGLNNLFIQNYDEDDEEMNKNIHENYRGDIYAMKQKEKQMQSDQQEMEEEDFDEDFLELLND